MVLKGKGTKLYGNVQFGLHILIEDNVVIGHPSPDELKDCLLYLAEYESVEQLYESKSKAITTIGNNSIIRSGTVIYSGVTIGNNFYCAHNVVIREGTTIGDFVYLKKNTEIMRNVKIGSHCRLAGMVGDNSTIANHVSSFGILTHKYARHYTPDMALSPGPVIAEGCIVGRGATLVGGIHVQENSIIGANTLVNFDIPPGSFVVGFKGQMRSGSKGIK